MPYIKIQVTGKKVTPEQSRALITQTTEMMKNVLNKNPDTTFVVIEEIPGNHWGVSGKPHSELFPELYNDQ